VFVKKIAGENRITLDEQMKGVRKARGRFNEYNDTLSAAHTKLRQKPQDFDEPTALACLVKAGDLEVPI